MKLLRLFLLLFAVGLIALMVVMLFARREEVRARWLAFVSLRDGQFDVYMQDIYSGEVQRITTTPAIETSLTWSPNASQLLYSRTTANDQQIASLNLRSKVETVLLRDRNYVNRVVWTGKTIVFDEFVDDEQSDIFGLDLNTFEVYSITDSEITEVYPEISTNGIIYAAIREPGRDVYGLYSTTGDVIIENEFSYLNPSLSPDGRFVVASRFTQRRFDLAKIDIKTGEETLLNLPQSNPGLPRWSPDGRWIAYVAVKAGNFEIYITDGERVQQITDHPLFDSSPAWMPVVNFHWHINRLSGAILLLVGLQILLKPTIDLFAA